MIRRITRRQFSGIDTWAEGQNLGLDQAGGIAEGVNTQLPPRASADGAPVNAQPYGGESARIPYFDHGPIPCGISPDSWEGGYRGASLTDLGLEVVPVSADRAAGVPSLTGQDPQPFFGISADFVEFVSGAMRAAFKTLPANATRARPFRIA